MVQLKMLYYVIHMPACYYRDEHQCRRAAINFLFWGRKYESFNSINCGITRRSKWNFKVILFTSTFIPTGHEPIVRLSAYYFLSSNLTFLSLPLFFFFLSVILSLFFVVVQLFLVVLFFIVVRVVLLAVLSGVVIVVLISVVIPSFFLFYNRFWDCCPSRILCFGCCCCKYHGIQVFVIPVGVALLLIFSRLTSNKL